MSRGRWLPSLTLIALLAGCEPADSAVPTPVDSNAGAPPVSCRQACFAYNDCLDATSICAAGDAQCTSDHAAGSAACSALVEADCTPARLTAYAKCHSGPSTPFATDNCLSGCYDDGYYDCHLDEPGHCGQWADPCVACPSGVCVQGSCRPVGDCPAWCNGCCSPSGACKPGFTTPECGSSGSTCRACPGGLECASGRCL